MQKAMMEGSMSPYLNRIRRALKLDPALFEEVEADRHATGEAVGVVLLSSGATGLGAIPQTSIGSLAILFLAVLVGWCAWVYVTFVFGVQVFSVPETDVDVGQIVRTSGYAAAPGLFAIFGVVPFLYFPALALALVWMLAAMVVSVRQAFDYSSTWRALGVCAAGWIVLAAYIGGVVLLLQ